MAQYEDKFYYVDPGIGTKKDNCPYSFYKDGHDVVDFIIPPEGYVFKAFKYEKYDGDEFYEGRIVAEYEVGEIKKDPLLKPYMWVLLGIAAIACMLFAAYCTKRVIKKVKKRKARMTIIDLTTDTAKIDTTTTDTTSFMIDSSFIVEPEQQPTVVEPKQQPTVVESEQQPSVVEVKQDLPKPVEKSEVSGDALVQFQNEFWDMVHRTDATMDDFYNQYVKYKKRVKCEEYDYLRVVILQNYATFKKWNKELLQIPPEELQSINDITTLKEKIDIKI